MQKIARIAVVVLSLLFALPTFPQNRSRSNWTKSQIIEALNRAAGHFNTLTAKLEYTKVTAVVDHKAVEHGRLTYDKDGRVLVEFDNPEPKKMLFTKNKAFYYLPKINTIQEFDLSKHRDKVEQFLLLGFGTKGDDLEKAYVITVLGETKLGDDMVLQTELTPKDDRIRGHLHKIHLWFDMASWVPVQQKFFEIGGDYISTRYTEVKVNVRLPGKLKLNAPRGTRVVKPGGL